MRPSLAVGVMLMAISGCGDDSPVPRDGAPDLIAAEQGIGLDGSTTDTTPLADAASTPDGPSPDLTPTLPDGAPPTADSGGSVVCLGPYSLSAGANGDCFSEWSCDDGRTYRVECPAQGSCSCLVDGATTHSCTPTTSGVARCSRLTQCCGFPG